MSAQPVDRHPISGLVGRLQELLFPSRCPGCGRRGVLICDDCLEQVPWLGTDVCPCCALPRRSGWICSACRVDPDALDGARAACRVDGLVRKAIHELKYRGARTRAPLLASLLAGVIEDRPLQLDLLVPVPLASRRQRERGFNQAELIASALGQRLAVPVAADVLHRTRHTRPQVGQTSEQRRTNLAGAFACPSPDRIAGRRIGLVDDVLTTGSTLRGCAEELRAAGAVRVYGLVIAREV